MYFIHQCMTKLSHTTHHALLNLTKNFQCEGLINCRCKENKLHLLLIVSCEVLRTKFHSCYLQILWWWKDQVHILTIIIRQLGKLKRRSPIFWMKHNWKHWLYLRRTLNSRYMTRILEVQSRQISLNDDNKIVKCANKRTRATGHNVPDLLHIP